MKKIGYNLVKWWIKASLHLYYEKVKVSGLENIPTDKPVLFLPNHQSALMDVLLIAVDCNRKPYFLTRSDVFKNGFLNAIFDYFRMIPIYRIRDGREALKNNQAVFDRCSQVLMQNQAIVIFPEASHNLRRRVRPLSKGFTRILFNTLEKVPNLDIRLVPVGINYKDAEHFPDSVALYFGKDIAVQELYDGNSLKPSTSLIKEAVSDRLKLLTTHIEDEGNYDQIVQKLDAMGVDYLTPQKVNEILGKSDFHNQEDATNSPTILSCFFKGIFMLLNFPILIMWRKSVKPKVWEPEFMGTMRFAFALIAYPIYFLLLFGTIAPFWGLTIALVVVGALFLFNVVYTKSK